MQYFTDITSSTFMKQRSNTIYVHAKRVFVCVSECKCLSVWVALCVAVCVFVCVCVCVLAMVRITVARHRVTIHSHRASTLSGDWLRPLWGLRFKFKTIRNGLDGKWEEAKGLQSHSMEAINLVPKLFKVSGKYRGGGLLCRTNCWTWLNRMDHWQ